jgi:hypothetical protein
LASLTNFSPNDADHQAAADPVTTTADTVTTETDEAKYILADSQNDKSIATAGTTRDAPVKSDSPGEEANVGLVPQSTKVPSEHANGTADHHALREWIDSSGSFKTKATFMSMTAGKVKLRKPDGSVIEVPIEKLSLDDQQFIAKLKK